MRDTDKMQVADEKREPLSRLAELERDNRRLRREIEHLKNAVAQEKIAHVMALNRLRVGTLTQRERDRYLSLLLANSPSIILFLNFTGRVEFCTNYFVAKAGFSDAAEVMGRTAREILARFLDEASCATLLERIERASLTNEPLIFDITFHFNPDSAKEEFSGMLVPMKDERQLCNGVMLMLHDVTDLKRSREAALMASRAKSDFLSNISHEIRTPLNAIIGMTELAIWETVSDAARDYMLTVKQAGINLLAIVNDILDLSRIEQDKLEILPGRYMAASLIEDTVNVIRMRVSEKPVRFVVRVDSRMPRELIGDEMKIRQILVNLLGNAVKFTDSGFISLAVTGEATGGETIDLVVEVADSGIGIREEDLGGIFDAYTQINQRKGVQTEGTGLGLAITKGLVSAMGGGIGVRSAYGKGSVFTVTLPQVVCSGEPLAAVAHPGEKSVLVYAQYAEHAASILYALENLGVRCASVQSDGGFYEEMGSGRWPLVFASVKHYESVRSIYAESGYSAGTALIADYGDSIPDKRLPVLYMPAHAISIANLLNGGSDGFPHRAGEKNAVAFTVPDARILVVDDIETNLKVADGLLRPYEMKVDLRKSGEDAIEAVRATRYDLVFMDHKMPGMDGIETVRRIRAMGCDEPYYRGLPIVALTANAVSGMEETFMQNGFNGFLSKPISLTALNAILKKWIDKGLWQSRPSGHDGFAGGVPERDLHIEIEGVDVSCGLSLARGDVGLYMETLAVFHKDGLEKIGEIGESLASGDLSLFSIYVHALKSACANIGAMALSEAAKALELAAERGDARGVGADVPAFVSSLTLLLERINEATAKYGEDRRGGMREPDREALASGLAGLKAAIAKMDAAAMNRAVRDLQKLALSEDSDALIGGIREDILLAEYDEAIRLIDAFLAQR